MAAAIQDEVQAGIRDDVGKWMGILASVNLPASIMESLEWAFSINNIGYMQASIRSEADLGDFLFAMLSQVGGPLLAQTGTEGWEKDLPDNNYRVC